MALALLCLLAGCGDGGTENTALESVPEAESANADNESGAAALPDEPQEADGETPDMVNEYATKTETQTQTATDKLVVYFSRIGEQYSVGVIEKGNTAIVAEMVAKRTGADVFEITPAVDNYPTDNYRALTDIGLQEQKEGGASHHCE